MDDGFLESSLSVASTEISSYMVHATSNERTTPEYVSLSHFTDSLPQDGCPNTNLIARRLPELAEQKVSHEHYTETIAPVVKSPEIHRQTKWQNIVSSDLNPHGRIKEPRTRRKTGRRTGRLDPENAKRATEIRRIRACLSCWLLKIPVCVPYSRQI